MNPFLETTFKVNNDVKINTQQRPCDRKKTLNILKQGYVNSYLQEDPDRHG